MRDEEATNLDGNIADSWTTDRPVSDSPESSSCSQEFSVDEFSVDSTSGSIAEIENIVAGQTIGRYKLRHLLGTGGMGAVWLAEQTKPVSRRVALKLIRADVSSKSKIARFEAERQAIAIMDHPNIAKIHDAGTTPGGNPYFVMELVKGIPMSEFCDRKKLTINRRLELMLPVLSAVQHAHQKAIIHRDLKHSNVLVSSAEEPTPKVIDFGLAKALGHNQTLTDKTMFTELGAVVGTLQYMSPEQASDENVDIDTRADVYALGVMIYKLLTGTTPFVRKGMTEKSVVGMLEKIRSVDPPKPSARLAEAPDELGQLAHVRGTTSERLIQEVAGDLDWIVMKALDKDRRLRYDSASALATEIKRYLNDETVIARPPSGFYIAKKFVRRNKGLVTSIAAMISLLLAGIIGTTLTSIWALDETARATELSEQAKAAASDAQTAMREAQVSESKHAKLQARQAVELHAYRMKQAWSDWQRSSVESAWQKLDDTDDLWETRFLRTQFNSSKNTLHGHTGTVSTVDASKDGKYYASASIYNCAIVWNATDGSKVFEWHPDDDATCIRFSPDSSLVGCSTKSNTIAFWSLATGNLVKTLGPFETDVTSFDFCDNMTTLVVGHRFGTNSAREKRGKGRLFLEANPNAPLLQVVSFADGKLIEELKGHSGSVTGVNCSDEGNLIVSSSEDSSVKIWTRKKGRFTETGMLPHATPVQNVALSPAADFVATGLNENIACLWNLKEQKLIRTMSHDGAVTGVAFSNDGTKLATASDDRTATIWDIETGEQVVDCLGHFGELRSVVFSNDSSEVITVSKDSTVRVWNSTQRRSSITSKPHAEIIWDLSIFADQKQAVSVSQDGSICITNLATGIPDVQIEPIDCEFLSVATSPTLPIFATGSSDFKVRIWDRKTGSLLKEIVAHEHDIWSVHFSPDGKQLISACANGKVHIWDTLNWQSVAILNHPLGVTSAQYSHDGRHILTGCDDTLIRIWNAETHQLVSKLKGHDFEIWRAIYSPDDSLIASSGYNGEVFVWDASTGEQIHKLKGHRVEVAGLAFAENGSRLFSASDDGTIKIWDVESGIDLFEFLESDLSQSVCVGITDDGRKLVSGNYNGRLTIRTAELKPTSSVPLRPSQVDELTLMGETSLLDPELDSEQLKNEMEIARECCELYPYFSAWANLGISQCRLGDFPEAEVALREALRLEKIQYGYDDERPRIEGYLSMALAQQGNFEGARQFRGEFIRQLGQWAEEPWTRKTLAEIDRLLDSN